MRSADATAVIVSWPDRAMTAAPTSSVAVAAGVLDDEGRVPLVQTRPGEGVPVADDVSRAGGPAPQWLKYVRWDVIARWRKEAKAEEDAGGEATTSVPAGPLGDEAPAPPSEHAWPYEFGSRDASFRRIGGGVLWLVASPRYGAYRMPPTLVARLHIRDVIADDDPRAAGVDPHVRRHGPWLALAFKDPGAYLPLNNAFTVLRGMRFDGNPDRLPDSPPGSEHGPYAHLPAHMQRHRVLTPDSAAALERYAAAVRAGRRVFLSYSWADFTADREWVTTLADNLAGRDVSCWWDRWQLPESGDDPAVRRLLGDILTDAVHQSVWFVALVRPRYATGQAHPGDDPPWAAKEWRRAGSERDRHRRDDLRRVAIVFGDAPATDLHSDDLVLRVREDASPRHVADRLLELLPR
jgi:hypothetical protein